MSNQLSAGLRVICVDPEVADALQSYFDDCSDMEKGDHIKHSMCEAECTLIIDDEVVNEFPCLAPYLGGELTQQGTHDYNYGWDSYDSVELYTKELVPSDMELEFRSLMSHLNAEENGMAQEFKAKWFKQQVKYTKVV